MTQATTILGQPIGGLDVPASEAVVVLVVDIDDFEVLRLAHGDDWAGRQLEHVARVVEEAAGTAAGLTASTTFVATDSWIVALGSAHGDQLPAPALKLAERIRAEASAPGAVSVSVGVSRPSVGATRMESALAEAVSGVERKLIDSGDRVVLYDDTTPSGPGGEPERIEEELARAIRDSDVPGALSVLSAWIDRISALEGATPDGLRRWVTAEVMYALDVSGRRRLPDGSVDWHDAFSRLSLEELVEMSGIHERSYLMLWLQRLLDRIVEVSAPRSAGRHVLALVESYIRQHHEEDLRLATVASAVFVSPYYISHLFQRELGTTFLKYLTGVRMQRARELLAGSELPVEVVSARVGYASSKRFRTLFKRTFKVTPTEYRAQHGTA